MPIIAASIYAGLLFLYTDVPHAECCGKKVFPLLQNGFPDFWPKKRALVVASAREPHFSGEFFVRHKLVTFGPSVRFYSSTARAGARRFSREEAVTISNPIGTDLSIIVARSSAYLFVEIDVPLANV